MQCKIMQNGLMAVPETLISRCAFKPFREEAEARFHTDFQTDRFTCRKPESGPNAFSRVRLRRERIRCRGRRCVTFSA
jgi:hypothetical protein